MLFRHLEKRVLPEDESFEDMRLKVVVHQYFFSNRKFVLLSHGRVAQFKEYSFLCECLLRFKDKGDPICSVPLWLQIQEQGQVVFSRLPPQFYQHIQIVDHLDYIVLVPHERDVRMQDDLVNFTWGGIENRKVDSVKIGLDR